MSAILGKIPPALLAHSLLLQLSVSVARPASSYRGLGLGIEPALLGMVAASFSLLPIFFAYRAGRATDTGKRGSLLYVGAAMLVVGSLGLLFLTPSIVVLLGWNVVLGLGHLLSIVGEQSIVASGKTESLDGAFGLYTFATSAGQALGPLVLALIGGSRTIPDTKALFLCAAVAAVATAYSTFFLVRRTVQKRGNPERPRNPAGRQSLALDVGKRRRIYRAIWISSTVLGVLDLVGAYLPALGVERGISAATIGMMLFLRALATMVSRLFIGPAAGRLSRRVLVVLSCGVFTLGTAGIALSLGVQGLAVSMLCIGVAFGFTQPLTMSIVTLAAPPGTGGTWLALRMGANRIGQTAIPAGLGGLALNGGPGAVFILASGFLTVATMIAWRATAHGPES